jgi:hypothetical protein
MTFTGCLIQMKEPASHSIRKLPTREKEPVCNAAYRPGQQRKGTPCTLRLTVAGTLQAYINLVGIHTLYRIDTIWGQATSTD